MDDLLVRRVWAACVGNCPKLGRFESSFPGNTQIREYAYTARHTTVMLEWKWLTVKVHAHMHLTGFAERPAQRTLDQTDSTYPGVLTHSRRDRD